ncbi:hypothetical protein MHYP_G00225780 [Metynnis hypsauchen]
MIVIMSILLLPLIASALEMPPIKQRHRRVLPQIFQEFKKHVQDLVSQGILRESCSSWASPAVIVIKKYGSVRFCCDYCRLNQVTCKDAYPLPRVEDSLDALGGAQLFSTLDLTASYFQIETARPEAKAEQVLSIETEATTLPSNTDTTVGRRVVDEADPVGQEQEVGSGSDQAADESDMTGGSDLESEGIRYLEDVWCYGRV